MNRVATFIGLGIASAIVVNLSASPAYAWHPVGTIKKEVQNVSQNSGLKDANSAADAVSAKQGDTLKYVITVKNNGKYDKKGWNDMHYTKVTDQLPAGVTLVSGDTNKDLGHIKAGESKSYEFTVKVTSKTNKEVICNTAKFTGDSEVKDQPQSGQDKACVTVVVPEAPKKPEEKPVVETPEPKPVEKPKPIEKPVKTEVISKTTPEATVVELPRTGLANGLGSALSLSALTAGLLYLRNRQ